MGNEKFFTEIEPPRNLKPKGFSYFSTTEKLREICRRSDACAEYPEHHIQLIDALFETRDKLVHMKPRAYSLSVKPYNYEQPEENYREYIDMYQELNFVYKDIEQKMQLYVQLQENIKKVRGANLELTTELTGSMFDAINNAVLNMLGMQKDEGEK